MQIELSRTTFRRLVQLHIAMAVLSLVSYARLYLMPSWIDFSADFEGLIAEHFARQEPPEWQAVVAGVVFLVVGIWSIASLVGLLWFKRWARLGSWLSLIIFFVLGMLLGGKPSFSTLADDALLIFSSGLFGAIVLLSYAKGLGSEWFARSALKTEE